MAQSSVFLGRREGEDLGVVRNSKEREMHSLRQSSAQWCGLWEQSQPHLRGQQEVCPEGEPVLRKRKKARASRRGGGSDTGDFAEDRLRLWEGEVGRVSGDEEAGRKDRMGLVGALWRIQVQVLRGGLGGSDD